MWFLIVVAVMVSGEHGVFRSNPFPTEAACAAYTKTGVAEVRKQAASLHYKVKSMESKCFRMVDEDKPPAPSDDSI